jgi:hypothetical protein
MPPVILNLAPTPLYASRKNFWYQMDNKPSGLRDGLDVLENTKDSPVIQPVVSSLYLLSYPAPL